MFGFGTILNVAGILAGGCMGLLAVFWPLAPWA